MQGPTSVYSEPTWLDTPLRTKGGPAARTDHRSPAPRAPGRPGTSSAPLAAGGEARSGAATFPCLPPARFQLRTCQRRPRMLRKPTPGLPFSRTWPRLRPPGPPARPAAAPTPFHRQGSPLLGGRPLSPCKGRAPLLRTRALRQSRCLSSFAPRFCPQTRTRFLQQSLSGREMAEPAR